MPKRAPIRGYRGPAWDRYIDKEPKEKVVDPVKMMEEKRKEQEWLWTQAQRAALGGDYRAAEVFLDEAGYPIERRQTAAPPSDDSMVVRGPGESQGKSGRALFARKGGGPMAPGDENVPGQRPEELMKMLQDKFAAEKGYPTSQIAAPVASGDRIVGVTPEGKYEERLGVHKEPKAFGKGEWPQTYYNAAGERRTVTDEKDAKDAIGSGYGPEKPDKEEKPEKYEKRTFYKADKEWEIRSPAEEIQATSQGFSPIKPGETEASKKDKEAESKNRVTKLKGILAEIREKYKGQDKLLDALLARTDKTTTFSELAELGKNAYERLKNKAKNAATPEDKEEALQDLATYGKLFNRLLAEEGLAPVGGEGPPPPLGTGGSSASDYINNALGQGTQL